MMTQQNKNNLTIVPHDVLAIPASIHIGGGKYRGDIVNITATAASLILIEPLTLIEALPSARLTLHITRFGDFEAQITHIDNHRVNLEFCENHKAMMGLIRSYFNA